MIMKGESRMIINKGQGRISDDNEGGEQDDNKPGSR
jgi:hypothetical protein